MKLKNIRKIFILGDLHLGVRNNSIEWSDIQSDYLVNHFLKQVDQEGFDPERDILVQVGDWNHVRESTNVRIYKQSLEIAKILTEKFKRGVYVILGNHDVYYKDRTDTHSLEGFDKIYPNFHIFTKAEPFILDSHKFLMLPWIENIDELKAAVAQFNVGIAVRGDIIYNGNTTKWTKFANSLRMMMALRLSKVDAAAGKAEFAAVRTTGFGVGAPPGQS